MYILLYKLGIKYVTFEVRPDPWSVRVSAMPSAEPSPFMPPSRELNFWERILSLALYVSFDLFKPPSSISDDLITEYAPEREKITFQELLWNSELWLANVETLCLEHPKVVAPHFQYVRGMNTWPAKPLHGDLERFVQNVEGGLVLLSFGSLVQRLPEEMIGKLMTALGQIRYQVAMRYENESESNSFKVPSNVLLLKWLPQNDILGHSNTKLFITHAGHNSQLEALYHGVPMLSFPIFSDQPRNAKRSEDRGYGRTVDPFNFEVEELVSLINHMMENSTYRENIQGCSRIYHDFPSAQETIKFHVEHVLKFGGSHLKPVYLRQPLWKLFMLDVLLFLSIVTCVVVCLIGLCCWCLCRKW